jgi:hypothetical protein
VGLTLGLMLIGAVLFVVWLRRSRRFGEGEQRSCDSLSSSS